MLTLNSTVAQVQFFIVATIHFPCHQISTLLKFQIFSIPKTTDDGNDKPEPREGSLPKPEEYMCLIRAKSKSKKVRKVTNYCKSTTHKNDYLTVVNSDQTA